MLRTCEGKLATIRPSHHLPLPPSHPILQRPSSAASSPISPLDLHNSSRERLCLMEQGVRVRGVEGDVLDDGIDTRQVDSYGDTSERRDSTGTWLDHYGGSFEPTIHLWCNIGSQHYERNSP